MGWCGVEGMMPGALSGWRGKREEGRRDETVVGQDLATRGK